MPPIPRLNSPPSAYIYKLQIWLFRSWFRVNTEKKDWACDSQKKKKRGRASEESPRDIERDALTETLRDGRVGAPPHASPAH
jgi:hypothetical protein